MKDEIKEILDTLENKECYINDEMLIYFDDAKLLLDYITNLQEELYSTNQVVNELLDVKEENERLKEENKTLKDTLKLRTEIGSYMKRKIDNAIEYCNLYTRLSAKDLLNILNGADE